MADENEESFIHGTTSVGDDQVSDREPYLGHSPTASHRATPTPSLEHYEMDGASRPVSRFSVMTGDSRPQTAGSRPQTASSRRDSASEMHLVQPMEDPAPEEPVSTHKPDSLLLQEKKNEPEIWVLEEHHPVHGPALMQDPLPPPPANTSRKKILAGRSQSRVTYMRRGQDSENDTPEPVEAVHFFTGKRSMSARPKRSMSAAGKRSSQTVKRRPQTARQARTTPKPPPSVRSAVLSSQAI